jgi:hypothetical protein
MAYAPLAATKRREPSPPANRPTAALTRVQRKFEKNIWLPGWDSECDPRVNKHGSNEIAVVPLGRDTEPMLTLGRKCCWCTCGFVNAATAHRSTAPSTTRLSRYRMILIFLYFVTRAWTRSVLKFAWRYLQGHPLCRQFVFPCNHDHLVAKNGVVSLQAPFL